MGFFSSLANVFTGTQDTKALRKQTKAKIGGLEERAGFLEPFGGTAAHDQLSSALGVRGVDAQQSYFDQFQNDPGFQSALQFGLDQVSQQKSQAGLLKSGGAAGALFERGQRAQLGSFQDRLRNLRTQQAQELTVGSEQGNIRANIGQIEGNAFAERQSLKNAGMGRAFELAGSALGMVPGMQGVGSGLSSIGRGQQPQQQQQSAQMQSPNFYGGQQGGFLPRLDQGGYNPQANAAGPALPWQTQSPTWLTTSVGGGFA